MRVARCERAYYLSVPAKQCIATISRMWAAWGNVLRERAPKEGLLMSEGCALYKAGVHAQSAHYVSRCVAPFQRVAICRLAAIGLLAKAVGKPKIHTTGFWRYRGNLLWIGHPSFNCQGDSLQHPPRRAWESSPLPTRNLCRNASSTSAVRSASSSCTACPACNQDTPDVPWI